MELNNLQGLICRENQPKKTKPNRHLEYITENNDD